MNSVTLLDLASFDGEKGSLLVFEQNTAVMPFDLKRAYHIYGVPPNERRGFHAHKALKQLITCQAGSCKIDIRTEVETKTFVLDRPNKALYIGEPVWREMYDFSEQSVLVVYASELYDPDDYIWDFEKLGVFRKSLGL